MLKKKQGQGKTWQTIRQSFQRGTKQEGYRKVIGRSTIWAKRKSCCFDRIALERHDLYSYESRTFCKKRQNIRFFFWMLMGLKDLFDSVQKFCHGIKKKTNALKCKTLTCRTRGKSLRPIRPRNIKQRQREDQQFERGEKTSITMPIGILGWRCI